VAGTEHKEGILRLFYGLRRWLLHQSWFTSTVLPMLPRRVRWTLRKLYFAPVDALERATGLREELTPPKAAIFTGTVDDFASGGAKLVAAVTSLGYLGRDSTVLDVGCGLGRVAVALIRSGAWEGVYEGLDIVPAGIEWCNAELASRYPTLHFTLADLFNGEYNPTGTLRPSEYRFPYQDETFDLAVLVSVFTHLLPTDMEHYVSEISRVLVIGGCCFATYSLLDSESLRAMEAGRSAHRFTRVGPHWTVDPRVPELAVAYEEEFVRSLFARHGMSSTVYHGAWSGRQLSPRDAGLDFEQDFVAAVRA
jgi:SAM-dependent methyltransferase